MFVSLRSQKMLNPNQTNTCDHQIAAFVWSYRSSCWRWCWSAVIMIMFRTHVYQLCLFPPSLVIIHKFPATCKLWMNLAAYKRERSFGGGGGGGGGNLDAGPDSTCIKASRALEHQNWHQYLGILFQLTLPNLNQLIFEPRTIRIAFNKKFILSSQCKMTCVVPNKLRCSKGISKKPQIQIRIMGGTTVQLDARNALIPHKNPKSSFMHSPLCKRCLLQCLASVFIFAFGENGHFHWFLVGE